MTENKCYYKRYQMMKQPRDSSRDKQLVYFSITIIHHSLVTILGTKTDDNEYMTMNGSLR